MGLLDGLIGGGARRGGGISPLTLALLGVLGYQYFKGKNLGDMLRGGGTPGSTPGGTPGTAPGQGGLGDLLSGGLGQILGGGAAGGILSGGLGDLLKQFQTHGQGDKAKSWVSTDSNEPISPEELEQSLGDERIRWLMQQTGMSKQDLLAGLSQELPAAVDQLTPQGRVPTDDEARRLI